VHGIVNKFKLLSDFGLSTLEIDRILLSDLVYNTTDIDGSSLHNFLDFSDLAEIKSLSYDRTIIFSLMDLRVLIKNNAEIILNRCELLVGHFDTSIGEKINFVLFKNFTKHFSRVIKESSLNLCSVLINHFNFEELSAVSSSFNVTSF
jgi:hypothetical protein